MFLFCVIQGSAVKVDSPSGDVIEAAVADNNVAKDGQGRAISCNANGECTTSSYELCRPLPNGQQECVQIGK